MSTTTSEPEPEPEPESATAATEPKRRYKRRKVAIFIAYCGFGYQGMQKNPGARTIESELEEALFLSGAVPESDRSNPKRYDWARSARTDKGVSAAGQVVSGRFYIDPPGFVQRMNSNLSDQIRVLGFKRVATSFNANKFCGRRRYVYLLPVFALDPNSHESVTASSGSGDERVECVECSERGRKVAGVMGRQCMVSEEEGNVEFGVGIGGADEKIGICSGELKIGESAATKCEEKSDLGASDLNSECVDEVEIKVSASEGKSEIADRELKPCEARISEVEPEEHSNNVSNRKQTFLESRSTHEYGDKERERFNGILKRYAGTHNFHNFTTRTKAEDPSARRYIISFNADSVVSIDGIEFVRCEVVGQSFMLHQVRKMIGFAVAIMRNCCPESLMDIALSPDININVPTAPEVGLYLDECFFTSYNQKWKESHEELSMDVYVAHAEEFKQKHIFSHIAAMEHKGGAVALWLHSLNHHNYPDFRFQETNGILVNSDHVQVTDLGD